MNICWRVTASLTGRAATFAAIAATMACGRGVPFEPKPPPTCGAITRTFASSIPNAFASTWRAGAAPCVESYSVRLSSSPQTAMLACGSIGLLWNAGVS